MLLGVEVDLVVRDVDGMTRIETERDARLDLLEKTNLERARMRRRRKLMVVRTSMYNYCHWLLQRLCKVEYLNQYDPTK